MNKRVLVTGAASGMGAAVVALLLERGASVVAVDHDEQGLRRVTEDQRGTTTIPIELTDTKAIADSLANLKLDAVANVAGLGPDSSAVRESFQVNLVAPLLVLRTVRPHLSSGAPVVNVASIVAALSDERFDELLEDPLSEDFLDRVERVVPDGSTAYTYSKRGLLHHSEQLAGELAPEIRVNVVSPGLVDTPLGARSMEFPWTQKLSQRVPLQRHAQSHEVAHTIVFLLSEEAAYITGADVPVDGGYTAIQHQRQRTNSVGADHHTVANNLTR